MLSPASSNTRCVAAEPVPAVWLMRRMMSLMRSDIQSADSGICQVRYSSLAQPQLLHRNTPTTLERRSIRCRAASGYSSCRLRSTPLKLSLLGGRESHGSFSLARMHRETDNSSMGFPSAQTERAIDPTPVCEVVEMRKDTIPKLNGAFPSCDC